MRAELRERKLTRMIPTWGKGSQPSEKGVKGKGKPSSGWDPQSGFGRESWKRTSSSLRPACSPNQSSHQSAESFSPSNGEGPTEQKPPIDVQINPLQSLSAFFFPTIRNLKRSGGDCGDPVFQTCSPCVIISDGCPAIAFVVVCSWIFTTMA
eukprot:6217431-Amphidinium_carterae.2